MDIAVVRDALTQIVLDIVNFIPNFINGLIILLVGYLVARVVRGITRVVLSRIGFDPLVERTGITGTLRGLGVRVPLSQFVAQIIFFLLLLSFLITSTRLMGLEAVAALLAGLLAFLPSMIAALIVFLLGGIVAKFLGDVITSMGLGTGLSYARRLGAVVQHLISLFVVVLALGVLGIDTTILITALTILIAAFGLALGLSLGLGSRGLVQHILAGHYMRQRLPMGQSILLEDVRGQVSDIGSVNTLVSTPDGEAVIPNALLLDSIIRAPGAATEPSAPSEPLL
jgi:small-conductance mechanosensitive channel